jgi:hypothetical protein
LDFDTNGLEPNPGKMDIAGRVFPGNQFPAAPDVGVGAAQLPLGHGVLHGISDQGIESPCQAP